MIRQSTGHDIYNIELHFPSLILILLSFPFLGIELIIIHKVEGFLLCDAVHVRDFVPELHTVELVGVLQQLGPEQGDDNNKKEINNNDNT